MPKHITALIAVSVLSTIAAVYGGVAGREGYLAIGLAAAFLSLIFIPVFYIRAKKRRRLYARQDALLVWDYAPSEAERIAAREAIRIRKTSIRLSILVSVCMAIIFAPFVALAETPLARYLLLYIGVISVLLPFSSVYIAPAYTVSLIKRVPSLTIVGRDYILINNRYVGINDRAELKLVSAGVKHGGDGEEILQLTYKFRMKYGNPISFPVDIPIPWGRSEQAVQFAERHRADQRS
jgi:hypothetical protein